MARTPERELDDIDPVNESSLATQLSILLDTIAPEDFEERRRLAQKIKLFQASITLEEVRIRSEDEELSWISIIKQALAIGEAERAYDVLKGIENWKFTFHGEDKFEIDGFEKNTINGFGEPKTIERPMRLVSRSKIHVVAFQGGRETTYENARTLHARHHDEIKAAYAVWQLAGELTPGQPARKSIRDNPIKL